MKNFILYFRSIVYFIISESPYIQKGTGKVNVKYGKNEHTASRCIISNYPNLKHLIDDLPTFFGKFFTILVSSSSVSFLLVFSFVMAQFFVHNIILFFDLFTAPTEIRTSMLLMIFTALGNHREIL